jgi:hypothetical protein
MKVYKSGYRNPWLSPYTILEKVFFWREIDYDEPVIERWARRLDPICQALMAVRKFVYPQINIVKIDRYDTWSMDHTLADIILPMLKQLQATKHGAPHVDDEDVPEYLRSYMAQPKENEWDTDSLHFMRWDWILSEMIWAFEQKVDDDADSKFFDHSEYKEPDEKTNHDKWFKDLSEGVSKVKYDQEGHTKWQERKANGFRLFGRYYENLWD